MDILGLCVAVPGGSLTELVALGLTHLWDSWAY